MIGENDISNGRNGNVQMLMAPAAPADDYWCIGDVSRRYDVSLRTLRFYEDRGLIKPLRHGTARLYDSACRARIEKILKAKRLGFTLGRIHGLLMRLDEPDSELEQTLAPAEITAQIESLERQRTELDHAIESLRSAHQRFLEPVESVLQHARMG
ncbi:MAG: zntR [Hyphomicrobiales bacterium]|nr:zntR [Hyphomicrobiales bacterium]